MCQQKKQTGSLISFSSATLIHCFLALNNCRHFPGEAWKSLQMKIYCDTQRILFNLIRKKNRKGWKVKINIFCLKSSFSSKWKFNRSHFDFNYRSNLILSAFNFGWRAISGFVMLHFLYLSTRTETLLKSQSEKCSEIYSAQWIPNQGDLLNLCRFLNAS